MYTSSMQSVSKENTLYLFIVVLGFIVGPFRIENGGMDDTATSPSSLTTILPLFHMLAVAGGM